MLSHSFWGSGIQEWHSWVVVAQGFSWGFSKALAQAAAIWRLGWGQRICFQDHLHAWWKKFQFLAIWASPWGCWWRGSWILQSERSERETKVEAIVSFNKLISEETCHLLLYSIRHIDQCSYIVGRNYTKVWILGGGTHWKPSWRHHHRTASRQQTLCATVHFYWIKLNWNERNELKSSVPTSRMKKKR